MPEPIDKVKAAFAERYEVERELGAGGMATVYLAKDLKHGRSVALKVLRPELAAALGADRFSREIHIIAQLSHCGSLMAGCVPCFITTPCTFSMVVSPPDSSIWSTMLWSSSADSADISYQW